MCHISNRCYGCFDLIHFIVLCFSEFLDVLKSCTQDGGRLIGFLVSNNWLKILADSLSCLCVDHFISIFDVFLWTQNCIRMVLLWPFGFWINNLRWSSGLFVLLSFVTEIWWFLYIGTSWKGIGPNFLVKWKTAVFGDGFVAD